MTAMTLNLVVMLLCLSQLQAANVDANMLASSLDVEIGQACSSTGSSAVELMQRRALKKHSDQVSTTAASLLNAAILGELEKRLPAEALTSFFSALNESNFANGAESLNGLDSGGIFFVEGAGAEPELLESGKYCSNNKDLGMGKTLTSCAEATENTKECSGRYFYFSPTYNGQCKCATDDCEKRGSSSAHNVYKTAPPSDGEIVKLILEMIEDERRSHKSEQPSIDAKLNDFSKCTGMPEEDPAAEKKAKDAKTAYETAADAIKTKKTASLSLDFGSSETSASIEKAGKTKDVETAHDAYTAALAAAAAALVTANQARESADDAHRLRKESKNMCFCNVKEAYDTEVARIKKRASSREKKITLLHKVKCAVRKAEGDSDYSKAFKDCDTDLGPPGLTGLDYKAKMASEKMPTDAKCNYDNVWFCVAQISKKKVKGPFIDVDEARTYLNKEQGSGSNRQMVCEMSISGAKSDPHNVGGLNQGGGAAQGFSGKFWYNWPDIENMNKMCNEDDACKKGYQ